MSKPKHPTARSIRQGQTVYRVVDPIIWEDDDTGPKYVVSYFIYSHKTPLPGEGEQVKRMSVSRLRRAFTRLGLSYKTLFYSKRRAEAAAKA